MNFLEAAAFNWKGKYSYDREKIGEKLWMKIFLNKGIPIYDQKHVTQREGEVDGQ